MEKRMAGVQYLLSLRARHYDYSILIYPSYRREYNIASFLVGAQKRIAHRYPSGPPRELSFLNNIFVPADKSLHNAQNDFALLRPFGIQEMPAPQKMHYTLPLTIEAHSQALAFLQNNGLSSSASLSSSKSNGPIPSKSNGLSSSASLSSSKSNGPISSKSSSPSCDLLVAIHPGSTSSPAALLRRWPPARYGEVAQWLIEKKKARILVFAGAGEMKEAKQIIEMANGSNEGANPTSKSSLAPRAILVSGLSLLASCALLTHCRLLLANDNGFGHLAAALDVPLLSLWGSTNPTWSRPLGHKVCIIRKATFAPWYSYELKRGIAGPSGMGAIAVSDVRSAIEKEI
jgi:heptosyltransferase-2